MQIAFLLSNSVNSHCARSAVHLLLLVAFNYSPDHVCLKILTHNLSHRFTFQIYWQTIIKSCRNLKNSKDKLPQDTPQRKHDRALDRLLHIATCLQ